MDWCREETITNESRKCFSTPVYNLWYKPSYIWLLKAWIHHHQIYKCISTKIANTFKDIWKGSPIPSPTVGIFLVRLGFVSWKEYYMTTLLIPCYLMGHVIFVTLCPLSWLYWSPLTCQVMFIMFLLVSWAVMFVGEGFVTVMLVGEAPVMSCHVMFAMFPIDIWAVIFTVREVVSRL